MEGPGPGREPSPAPVSELGAYGLRLRGVPAEDHWLIEQPDDAPLLHLHVSVGTSSDHPSRVSAESADLALLGGGRLQARRSEEEVRFVLPKPIGGAELVHPYLAPAAALRWQWASREALHAGVALIGGGAVLLFGAKGSGKSTTLAWLAERHGITVLSDDLAVIDEGRALAGPRSLDLRAGDSQASRGEAVRGGERRRVRLPPAPRSAPVRGCVVLSWGESRRLETVSPAARLELLAAQRSYPLPGDPETLLDLASLPTLRLTRPRSLDEREACAQALLERFGPW